MQPSAHGAHAAHGDPLVPGRPKHAEHFANWDVQVYASRFGMWLFLATEILLFAGLFLAYAYYREQFPETWRIASTKLDIVMGTVNTIVLITSSFTVAMSIHYTRINKPRLAFWMLAITILFALAFLVVKGFEYQHKFHDGLLPGKFFNNPEFNMPGGPLFFSLYFLATGLHAFHVIIGMAVLVWVAARMWKMEFSGAYYTPVELGGLYWHLVDLVWIFLYPLLYLI
jgi:cytochrome c oxidase subunit 3